MSTTQKIIKYLAIALGISIIVGLISTIVVGFDAIGELFFNDNDYITETKVISHDELNINSLKIKIGATKLVIKPSDSYKVETNNSNITYQNNDNNITISEKKTSWRFNHSNKLSVLTIYIPKNNEVLKELDLTAGAGVINISELNINQFLLKQGAGEVNIDNLNIFNEAFIKGGAGEMNVSSSVINNLDLKLGAGKFNFKGTMTGKNEINAGVGSIKINLLDNINNYQINTKKGLGTIKVDNKELSNDETFGEGNTILKIKGGVGDISIN